MKICKHNDGLGRCGISGERCTEGPCDCEEIIEYAPVQHGKWHAYENPLVKMIRCSRCGSVSSGRLAVETPYCPICGAKMDALTFEEATRKLGQQAAATLKKLEEEENNG